MKSYDANQLSTHLNALAELFDRKPLTGDALKFWFGTLKEFGAELIFGLLASWPKEHAKFPTPSDIWRIANEIRAADLERSAALQKKVEQQPVKLERTESGYRAMAEIRKLVQHRKPSPLTHWNSVLAKFAPGTAAHRNATQALAILGCRYRERQPGEDAEERAT